jgi:hypothetical protein
MLQSTPVSSGASARLFLDGIGAPVVARVTHRSAQRMTVSQALPFLKLHSSVTDEGGRRAEVACVSMIVEDGMPRLVLDLVYSDAEADAERISSECLPLRPEHTLPFTVERADLTPIERPRRATPRDATLQFVTMRGAGTIDTASIELAPRTRLARWFGWLGMMFRGVGRVARAYVL